MCTIPCSNKTVKEGLCDCMNRETIIQNNFKEARREYCMLLIKYSKQRCQKN